MNLTVLSSKGQVVIPLEIREHYKLKEGVRLSVQETSEGILLIPIPKNPLQAMKGLLKNTGIKSHDVKALRKNDLIQELAKA